MSESLMKEPIMYQIVKLPEDSPIGTRIQINMEKMHELNWVAHWTVLTTGQGLFELKCLENLLCPWQFFVNLEVCMSGETRVSEKMEKEVEFSQRLLEIKFHPIEDARRYNLLELKMTRISMFGIQPVNYLDFSKKGRWLDVTIQEIGGDKIIYASSSVLALHSPVLRNQFENGNLTVPLPGDHFAAAEQILNFLHPPCVVTKSTFSREVEKVMAIADEMEMEVVVKKCEEVLCEERQINTEGLNKSIKLAEKFHFRKLLEEVLYDVSQLEIFNLLKENKYELWIRAAMFDRILVEEDGGWSDMDEDITQWPVE